MLKHKWKTNKDAAKELLATFNIYISHFIMFLNIYRNMIGDGAMTPYMHILLSHTGIFLFRYGGLKHF